MNLPLRSYYLFATLFLAILGGCAKQQSSQQLQEKTADATAEMKRDAKAVATGIKEGWNRDRPLDLNSATKEQLMSLPGIYSSEADRVMAGRPYRSPDDLVTRNIMPKSEYDKISDKVTAKN